MGPAVGHAGGVLSAGTRATGFKLEKKTGLYFALTRVTAGVREDAVIEHKMEVNTAVSTKQSGRFECTFVGRGCR